MKISTILLTSSIVLTLWSCSGDKEEEILNTPKDTTDHNVNKTDDISANYETFFQVPSPGEMLTFIKSVGKRDKNKVEILNPTTNINKYTDNKTKAINFGIYTTDLSYCSIFNMGAEALKYFKVVKQLGDQLGLSSIIKPEILARIEKNVDNTDSLSVISDDLYYSSFETLDESKQGATLALVIAGGWIESMYIAVNMVDKFQANNPVAQRIADQKYTLENLIEFLKKHEAESADIKEVKTDLEDLSKIFSLLKEEKVTDTSIKSKDDKKIIGGGVNLIIDEKTFNQIKDKISNIRKKYTLN